MDARATRGTIVCDRPSVAVVERRSTRASVWRRSTEH